MGDNPILGILVDLEELKKTPNLVLWGRIARADQTISPHVKLLEIPLVRNIKKVEENGSLYDTYFTFE